MPTPIRRTSVITDSADVTLSVVETEDGVVSIDIEDIFDLDDDGIETLIALLNEVKARRD